MGRKIGMREFRKNYGLHLLNYSSSNYHPGNWVDYGDFVRNDRFQIKLESIARELELPDEEESVLAEGLKAIGMSDAEFAELEMTTRNLINADLDIPSINVDLRGKVDLEKVVSLKFGEIKVRELADSSLRDKIEDSIEDVEEGKGKKWRRLKRKGIVIKLFYASEISIEVEKEIDYDFGVDVEVSEVAVEASASGENQTNYKYSFRGQTSPFAVHFESVKSFIE
ncbi:MAG: hypothetical protein ACPGU4_12510 [Flavobacteriales bacterium]